MSLGSTNAAENPTTQSAVEAITLVLYAAAGVAVYFTAALYWFVGALLGGIACLETSSPVCLNN
jgi:hypothetical protein